MMEGMPELASPCDQVGECPNCHRGAFVHCLMEVDAEIHSWTLSPALEVQLRMAWRDISLG